jgi:crossover junction endodeoxyribonuclease RusA
MSRRLTWLDGWPPGPNRRMSWQARYRETAVWRRAASLGAYAFSVEPVAPTERLAVVVHGIGRRRVDLDNVLAACKPILDGLVDAGVLPDDDAGHIPAITVRRCECEIRCEQSVEVLAE